MSNENKLGQNPAFPCEYTGHEKDEFGMPLIVHRDYLGMSKRLFLAGMAMQGMITGIMASPREIINIDTGKPFTKGDIAEWSLNCSDELLRQESK